MLQLIYYYPFVDGAPAEVSRNIFSSLKNKNLFFNISVFPQYREGKKIIRDKYHNTEISSFRDLFKLSNNQIIHLTMSPIVFPNRKFLLYLLSLLNHKKLIINYHGDPKTEFHIKLSNRDLRFLIHFPNYVLAPLILKSADVVIVNSNIMKNTFRKKYKIKNLVVIPNGIDPSWLNSKNVRYDLKDGNPKVFTLFYHGRLAPEKGVEILIESIYNLTAKYNKDIKLYIAGEGVQGKYLKELCVKLGIEEKVVFLGKVPLKTLQSYLYSVDAAIYPSIYEPFSLAVLEALSTVEGPVIYSKNIGINDFVLKEGFNFYTFEPSIEGISNSIKMVLDKKCDERIHYKQKEFAYRYTWDNIVDEYIQIYGKYFYN